MSDAYKSMKQTLRKKNIIVQTAEERKLNEILNRSFHAQKNPYLEGKLTEHLMTRGQESSERKGMHASSLLVSVDAYCERQSVLSQLYRQNQDHEPGRHLKGIYNAGDFVHEMCQRQMLRAGWCDIKDLDTSYYNEEYGLVYSPDAKVFIPEFDDQTELIGEIKSMNDSSYKDMVRKGIGHKSAEKQVDFYMHMEGIKRGFTWCINKNTSESCVCLRDYNPNSVKLYVERLEGVKRNMAIYRQTGRLPKRSARFNISMKGCQNCHMYDACYKVGRGRIPL